MNIHSFALAEKQSTVLGEGWHMLKADTSSKKQRKHRSSSSVNRTLKTEASLDTLESSSQSRGNDQSVQTSSEGFKILINEENQSAQTSEESFAAQSSAAAFAAPIPALTLTDEIIELARGLRNDPKLIYEYVHDHIDYVPYYGSLKGATLTYFDGSGNDFDQVSLMVALLNASGLDACPTSPVPPLPDCVDIYYGDMLISHDEMANWIGIGDAGPYTFVDVERVVDSGRILIDECDAAEEALLGEPCSKIVRTWVRAFIDDVQYWFDPAFKQHTYTPKIDIATATGYNRTDLITEVTTGPGVDIGKNLDQTGLNTKLVEYTNNLINDIRTNYPNSSVQEILGGKNIIKTQGDLQDFDDAIFTHWPFGALNFHHSIPFCITATLHLESVIGGIDVTKEIPGLNGDRLIVNTAGSDSVLTLEVDHPYEVLDVFTCPVGTLGDQSVNYDVKANSTYAIIYDFGGTNDNLIQKRQKMLDEELDHSLPSDPPEVLYETLHIMGFTWMKEINSLRRILSSLNDSIPIQHHAVGLMAQEDGYYLDVGGIVITDTPKSSSVPINGML